MRTCTTVLALTLCLSGLTTGRASAQPPSSPTGDLALFTTWLAGEFDNFQQVSEQIENKVATPHGRRHIIITPILAPSVGSHVFLARVSALNDVDGPGEVRVYAVVPAKDSFVLKMFAIQDPAQVLVAVKDPAAKVEMTLAQLRPLPGCDMTWRREANAFVGTQVPGACRVESSMTSGQAVTGMTTSRLTAESVAVTETITAADGTVVSRQTGDAPFQMLRARSFVCWAALRKDQSEEYDGWRNLIVHDQGQWVPLPPEAGQGAQYAFELSQLRYAQQRPVMKLAIYEKGKALAVAYTWTEPGGKNIGVNLRWVQVGCKMPE